MSHTEQGYEITIAIPVATLLQKLDMSDGVSARGLTSVVRVTTENEMLNLLNKLKQENISLIKVEKLSSHLEDQLIDLLQQKASEVGS